MAIQNRLSSPAPVKKDAPTTDAPVYTPPSAPEPLAEAELADARARISELQEQIGTINGTYSHLPMSERDKAMDAALAPVVAEMNELRRRVKATDDAELAERRRLSAKRAKYVADNLDKVIVEAEQSQADALAALNAHKTLIRESERNIRDMRLQRLDAAAGMEAALDANDRKKYLQHKNEIDTLGFDVGVEEKRLAKLQSDLPPFVDAERVTSAELNQIRNQKSFQDQKAAVEKAIFAFAKSMGVTPDQAPLLFTRAVVAGIHNGSLPRPESM
jgi:hypothetical protein